MSIFALWGVGLLLGFSLVVPPGPMNALIASRSAITWRAGFSTGLGALTADAILGSLVYSFQSTVDLSEFIRPIYAVGAGVMAALAYLILRSPADSARASPANITAYSQGVIAGLSNPFQVVWWLTAGLGFAYVGGAPLFVGLFGAILIWVALFPYAIRSGTARYPAVAPWIRYASGALMAGFAIYFALLAVPVML